MIETKTSRTVMLALAAVMTWGGCGDDPRAALAGNWQLDAGPAGEQVYAFRDDGSLTLRTRDGAVMDGTFDVDDGLLVAGVSSDDGDEFELTATYHVSADTLVIAGAVPDEDVRGLVGTWRSLLEIHELDAGSQRETHHVAASELAFRGDGTVALVEQQDGEVRTGSGTYEQLDATQVRIAIEGDALDLAVVDGRSLGGFVATPVE